MTRGKIKVVKTYSDAESIKDELVGGNVTNT
jgi:hypothetical protein